MSEAEQYEPFNPVDPFDVASEMFRRQVTDLALAAYKVTVYRDMPPIEQLGAFVAGVMTGLIGVCFASIEAEGRAEMMRFIEHYMTQAKEQASAMIESPSVPGGGG